jgi:hypothetical protein
VEIEPKYSILNSSNFTKEKTIPGLRFVLLAVKTKQKTLKFRKHFLRFETQETLH